MKRSVVLDKSFLCGAGAVDVGNLCEGESVLMSEALFFELILGDKEECARCFRKFPAVANPVELLPHPGVLMSFEIDNGVQASPIRSQRLAKKWTFSDRLGRGTFELNEKQKLGAAKWNEFIDEAAEGFRERILHGAAVVKGLPAARGRAFDFTIDAARDEVAIDRDSVRSFYEHFRPAAYPAATHLTPSWALFRWTQVQLSYVLDYLSRYGPGRIECSDDAVRHDVLDAQYLVTALLAGGLASRDNRMLRLFKALCPGCVVVN